MVNDVATFYDAILENVLPEAINFINVMTIKPHSRDTARPCSKNIGM